MGNTGTTEYLLDVPGLRDLDESLLGTAQALVEPFTALGEAILDLILPDGRRDAPTLEVEDDLEWKTAWPRGWSAARTVIRYAEDGSHRAAKLAIHYTHFSPMDGDVWRAELSVPGLPLWLHEDAVLSVSAQSNADYVTLVCCNVPDEWRVAVRNALGQAFGCDVTLEGRQDCAWRVPPDQPTFIHHLELPGPLFGDHAEAFVGMREPLQELAGAVLRIVDPECESTGADYVVSEDGGLHKAQATIGPAAGPQVEIELDHLLLSGVDFLSFSLRLGQPRPEGPQRGALELAFNSDRPDRLTVLKALSLPDAWLEPLIEALEQTFETRGEVVEIQPLLYSS